jgi:hypothetical protein
MFTICAREENSQFIFGNGFHFMFFEYKRDNEFL